MGYVNNHGIYYAYLCKFMIHSEIHVIVINNSMHKSIPVFTYVVIHHDAKLNYLEKIIRLNNF